MAVHENGTIFRAGAPGIHAIYDCRVNDLSTFPDVQTVSFFYAPIPVIVQALRSDPGLPGLRVTANGGKGYGELFTALTESGVIHLDLEIARTDVRRLLNGKPWFPDMHSLGLSTPLPEETDSVEKLRRKFPELTHLKIMLCFHMTPVDPPDYFKNVRLPIKFLSLKSQSLWHIVDPTVDAIKRTLRYMKGWLTACPDLQKLSLDGGISSALEEEARHSTTARRDLDAVLSLMSNLTHIQLDTLDPPIYLVRKLRKAAPNARIIWKVDPGSVYTRYTAGGCFRNLPPPQAGRNAVMDNLIRLILLLLVLAILARLVSC